MREREVESGGQHEIETGVGNWNESGKTCVVKWWVVEE